MAGRKNKFDRVKARKDAAEARQAARTTRSDAAQVLLLFERGHGHCKEAQRLLKKIVPEGQCYTLPNGDCVSPWECMHNG